MYRCVCKPNKTKRNLISMVFTSIQIVIHNFQWTKIIVAPNEQHYGGAMDQDIHSYIRIHINIYLSSTRATKNKTQWLTFQSMKLRQRLWLRWLVLKPNPSVNGNLSCNFRLQFLALALLDEFRQEQFLPKIICIRSSLIEYQRALCGKNSGSSLSTHSARNIYNLEFVWKHSPLQSRFSVGAICVCLCFKFNWI